VAKITAVLTELQKAITEELTARGDLQLEFAWTQSEKEQRERDLNSLRRRLAQIPDEIKRETEHLRSRRIADRLSYRWQPGYLPDLGEFRRLSSGILAKRVTPQLLT
jgi:chromosome segregation ATPase